jgi:glycosyltransferase involved in cell wall biosynthesis
VVTSRGTSTEEVAGGAAVLIDPVDVASISAGINDALARRDELAALGRAHAATQTWERTAALVVEAYAEAAR